MIPRNIYEKLVENEVYALTPEEAGKKACRAWEAVYQVSLLPAEADLILPEEYRLHNRYRVLCISKANLDCIR